MPTVGKVKNPAETFSAGFVHFRAKTFSGRFEKKPLRLIVWSFIQKVDDEFPENGSFQICGFHWRLKRELAAVGKVKNPAETFSAGFFHFLGARNP